MKIKNVCRALTLIAAIVMIFTVFATFSGVGTANTYASSETKMNIKGTVLNGPLNVRTGPSTSYRVIGTISKDKIITVLTEYENSKGEVWYKFKYSSSKYGYVKSDFIKLRQIAVGDKMTDFNRKAIVESNILNVRTGAGTIYEQQGALKKNEVIYITKKIIKTNGEVWYRFSYKGKYGYVIGKYLNVTNIVKETELDQKAIVTEGPLNIRSGPGTTYKIIGSAAEGTAFQALQMIKKTDDSIWYRYNLSSGKTGYVNSEYVDLTNIRTETEFCRKVLVSCSSLAVRADAGVTGQKTATLKKGDAIYVEKKLELINGEIWYQHQYKGKKSFSSGNSKYITLTDIVSEKDFNKKGIITALLNVRSGPGTNYSILGKVKKDNTLTFLQEVINVKGETWYKFKYSSEYYGYVSGEYVSMGVPVKFKQGTVITDEGISLNVRSDAGTAYTKLGSLPSGAVVEVLGSKKDSNGKVWYKYQFNASKVGWICSDYVKYETVVSNSIFEEDMDKQGFPDSYKPALRVLKSEHPSWVFKAYDVGCTWSTAVSKENAKPGLNVIDTSLPKSWRSKDSDCYNSKTGVWSRYDGRWYSAHTDVIRYYMDPRNFLNDSDIYQFLTHKYNSETQNVSTVKAVVDGTFMETRKPSGWNSFASLINSAGKNTGVNPNVLAAMIIQEQGTKGTSGLISGTYSGYKGYYNFLNVGAYTTSTMTAVQRGLWYAKEQGWNTEYKSIKGGAAIYHDNYVERNQYTFYTKKFNVMNGADKIGSHQYMTNVQGAAGEAAQLKKAFPENYNKALTFIIPVYDSMPLSPCDLP